MTYYAPTPSGQVARGRQLFEAQLGVTPYACVDCHTDTPEDPENPSLLVGHSLYDAASRPSWYGGKYKTRVLQGAQHCLTTRMNAKPLEGDDAEALQGYLQSISPSRKVPPLAVTQTESKDAYLSQEELLEAQEALGIEGQIAEGLARGNLLYLRACDRCHNAARRLAPPERELARPLEELQKIVRNGKGTMPGFPKERLSDADLNTIAAYLSWRAAQPTK